MNCASHWPIPDSTYNHSFPVKNSNVYDELMTSDIGPISPGPKFVYAKVERVALQRNYSFQLPSSHKLMYNWWIVTYPGVPYGRHPSAGGVDLSPEDIYREPPTDGNKWPTVKQL